MSKGGLVIDDGGHGNWHCMIRIISFELVCGEHIVTHKKSFETKDELDDWIKERKKDWDIIKIEDYFGDKDV